MRGILLSILFSISFCNTFIVSQRPIFNFLKWEEINSNHILFQKVGPLVNTTLDASEITSFYYSGSNPAGILRGEIFPEISINNTDGSRIRFYGSVAIIMSERLTIQNEFEFDNNGENDIHFKGSERVTAKGWVGYLQHSTLTYNYSAGHLSLGRGNPYFFNMNESLLINSNFPPTEFIWWHHKKKWFRFDWGVLFLGEQTHNHRFMTFHRYSIEKEKWRIGFTETVLGYYEIWNSKVLGYIMPANFMLETEVNKGIKDGANLMWLIDGMYKLDRWTIYSEFLIDDYAIDKKSPSQIAWTFGFGRKINKILLNMEYTRINRWVGNYCDTLNIWIHEKVPIGHKLGPDAHTLQLGSYISMNKELAIEIKTGWVEHGKGDAYYRLMEPWPQGVTCDQNFGYNKEKFPSQSNSYMFSHLIMYYYFRDRLMMNLELGINKTTNIAFKMIIKYS